MNYLASAFFNLENVIALLVHGSFLAFLFIKLKDFAERIPIIFLAQIPLLLFPFFRFLWSLSIVNTSIFVVLTTSALSGFIYFIAIDKNEEFKKLNIILLVLLCGILFSIIYNHSYNISVFASLYFFLALLALNFSFNRISHRRELVLLSLYYFLFASLIMMGVVFLSYGLKFAFPVSLKQIYLNKLMLTTKNLDQLRITGNMHNIMPFIFLINILSFSFIVYFLKNKNILQEINKTLNFFPSLYSLIILNIVSSLLLLTLFLSRGAIILMLPSYFILLYMSYKKTKLKMSLILLSITCFFYILFSSNNEIVEYFHLIYKSFYSLFLSLLYNSSQDSIFADLSVYERLEAIKKGLSIIKDNFLFGVGLDNYSHIETTYSSSHNFIIQHIAEMGIFGAVFITILLRFIIKELFLQKDKLAFCTIYPLALFVLYMTLFGGQLFKSGMLINGMTLFYVIYLHNHLRKIDFSQERIYQTGCSNDSLKSCLNSL